MGSPLFPPLIVTRKAGCEPFRTGSQILPFDILSFWQWSSSDLASNALRGMVAEFLVAHALGITGGMRIEWKSYDLVSNEGVTVEVKSAAYLQTWAQKAYSSINFDIAAKQAWDATTNKMSSDSRRQADVYVFALLHHRDKATVDPLDLSQWLFYVLPTAVLNARVSTQKQLGLNTLLRLEPEVREFGNLREAIARAAQFEQVATIESKEL